MKRMALLTAALTISAAAFSARAEDTYKADPVHSSALFEAVHVNAGHVWGRFNDPAGTFTLNEADPTKDTFTVEIQAANVDTHNDKRDSHLKSPDFFNAKQYPMITFKSTSVKLAEGKAVAVMGSLTMHGVTKPMTVPVEILGQGEFPPGVHRHGIEAIFTVKLSDFEIKGLPGAVGDEIKVIVSLEGVKQ